MQKLTKYFIRDVAIILGLTFLGGFIIGFTNPGGNNMMAIAVSNLIFSSLGFFIVGCLNNISRFKYLSKVALVVWLVGAHNIFFGITPIQWVFSLVFIFITLGIGGSLSFLAVKTPNKECT